MEMGLLVVVFLLLATPLRGNADEFTSCLEQVKNVVQDSQGSLAHWKFDSGVDVCNSSGPFHKEVSCNRSKAVFRLSLYGANLAGDFSSSFANCSVLTSLNLNINGFNGSLDGVCEKLQHLTSLSLLQNDLTGSLLKLGTCKSLVNLDISSNRLTGPLPRNIGNILPVIETFNASYNSLSGGFPSGFGNGECSSLGTLDLSSNKFTGDFPTELKFPGLTKFDVSRNNFSGVLYSYLQRFGESSFRENPRLVYQAAPHCLRKLHESVRDPRGYLKTWVNALDDICKLTGVTCIYGKKLSYRLNLAGRGLDGVFPPCLEDWVGLASIDLSGNRFTGSIPGFEVLIQSQTLSSLDLSNNNLTGPVPESIFVLEHLNVSHNDFSGTIPYSNAFSPSKFQGNPKLVYQGDLTCLRTFRDSVHWEAYDQTPIWPFDEASPWDICTFPGVNCTSPNVNVLDLSEFGLAGSFPRGLENCTQIRVLRLSNNRLRGPLPSKFCDSVAQSLVLFDMHGNELVGNVPDFSSCRQLREVDLSDNSLTGFAKNFALPISLEKLNLSYNRLNFVPEGLSFITEGNPSRHRGQQVPVLVFSISGAVSFLGLVAIYLGWRASRTKSTEPEDIPAEFNLLEHLHLKERDFLQLTSNFSKDLIVGRGGSSTVYQGILSDGQLVAVKKLEFEKDTILAARKNFIRELQILGKLRHRNLVKVLGYYSNLDIMAVILEYMPYGTLETLLHPQVNLYPLGWIYRHRFAVEVAQGLIYLHQECGQAVVHSDLKPSNILLDEEFSARIADFGVAKMLDGASQNTCTFSWTIGYAAPEVAQGARPTTKADVYSFGIILMEMLTGERPCSPKFEDVSFRQYVLTALAKGEAHGILDRDIQQEVEFLPVMLEVLKLALSCTGSSPTGRPNMTSVLEYLVWMRDKSDVKSRFNTPIATLIEQPSPYGHNDDEQAAQQISSAEVSRS